jgi:predicted nucleic acid-binding protein
VSPRQYLLDTDVLSATRRLEKNPEVAKFLRPLDPSAICISVLTLGEVRKGLVAKRRKSPDGVLALSHWIDRLDEAYTDRTLRIDAEIAKMWGELASDRSRPVVDTLLAATAVVHNLTLVTRNTVDFEDLPVKLFNPWQP